MGGRGGSEVYEVNECGYYISETKSHFRRTDLEGSCM